MIEIKRTNSSNKDFINLVVELDKVLAILDGDEHEFYDQFNKLDNINNVVVLYKNNIPISCGAFKKYSSNSVEIKRMFTIFSERSKGLASVILKELEIWALEEKYTKTILETGINQKEAISLYKRNGYYIIKNYGQYKNADSSVCFEKLL